MTLPTRLREQLSGVAAKLDRAEEQLAAFDTEWDRWREEEMPLGIECEIGDEGKRWLIVLRVTQPVPQRFGVMMGEIVHNLRSALDHLASYLVELHGREPSLTTAWPIERSRWAWSRKVERRSRPWQFWRQKRGGPLSGIPRSSAAWTLVQQSQPYIRSDKARHDPLWTLHRLWNADKHRLLTGFPLYADPAVVLDQLATLFPAEPIRRKALFNEGRPVKDGTKLAIFFFAEPCMPVPVDPKLTIQVALGDEKSDYDPTPFQHTFKVLRDLYRDAKALPYPP